MQEPFHQLSIATLFLGTHCLSMAGETTPATDRPNSGSMLHDSGFCRWLENKPGMVYKNSANPWIHELEINGRYHWQAAHIQGEGTTGQDFSENYTDSRRFRVGAKIGFLNHLTYRGSVNLVNDERFNGAGIDYGYQDFEESHVTFDIQQAFDFSGLDALNLRYGRIKWHGGLEARTSSNELLTVERSAISNKLFNRSLPTGLTVDAAKGEWVATMGIFSSDEATDSTGADNGSVEGWGGWNDGLIYKAEILYSAREHLRLGSEWIYNDANELGSNEDSLLDYRWATTLSAEIGCGGNGGVNLEGFFGDNGGSEMHSARNTARRGTFWGFVATPYYWIVPDKFQAVVQYAYAGSEEDEGIRTNLRYVRATNYGGGGNPDVTNSGRGDELHTVYAGLNYLICGDNLKVQLGAEYSSLNTPGRGDGDVDALTYLFGFRSFF
jgi:hypothetical protein